MSIRKHNKDYKPSAEAEVAAPESAPLSRPEFNDPLQYWTLHAEPVFVDLRPFRDGQQESKGGGEWAGPYTGRPKLIYEMAVSYRALTEYLTPGSQINYQSAMRGWWRVFDEVEAECVANSRAVVSVSTISDITEIHRSRATEKGMNPTDFRLFRRVLELARQTHDLPPLHWPGMADPDPERFLPPPDDIKQIRVELKHTWFRVIWRWGRADALMQGDAPLSLEEARLRKNYRRFRIVITRHGHQRPRAAALYGNVERLEFNNRGYRVSDMVCGFYPDGEDIRAAFHVCLASTGWNSAVLLALDVDDEFIVPHPTDPLRYVMYGIKRRGGGSEQVYEGLYKSQSSAGMVIRSLIERTAPLREQLRSDLSTLVKRYRQLESKGTSAGVLSKLRNEIEVLRAGVKSPWLYVSYKARTDIQFLRPNDFSRAPAGTQFRSYLDGVVERLNSNRPPEQKIQRLLSGDFRDAFAEYAFRASGGMVLYVMKALGHKRLRSTRAYIDNTFINAESDRRYVMFSQSLWDEVRDTGRVDPSVLAIRSRDGKITDKQRARLEEYRHLRRSRVGMGCKDPHNPPKHIAPDFVQNGKANCPVQRCTLCLENGVVFEDSIDGLCMRYVELETVRENISVSAYLESSFPEELENTRFALNHFEEHQVQLRLEHWRKLVRSGEHRVIDLVGV